MARTASASKALDPARNPTFAPASEASQQYICLVYQDDRKLMSMPEAEMDSIVAGCIAWIAALEEGGHHVLSAGLQSVRGAIALRERNGKVSATDGPFAETKEHLGGFTIISARDLNEAIALASRLPAAKIGTVEVRPVLRSNVDSHDPLDRKINASIRRCAAAAEKTN